MLGARKALVLGEAEHGFKVTPQAVRAALTSRTKAILLNSPSNPAGVTYVLFLATAPDFRHRTITINLVSHAYAMTGRWIGWASAPVDVLA